MKLLKTAITSRRKQRDNCEQIRETGRRLFLSVRRNADKDPSILRGLEDWNVLTTIYNDYPFNSASRSVRCAAPHRSEPLFCTRHCALWAVTWIISVSKLRLNTLSTYANAVSSRLIVRKKTNRWKINIKYKINIEKKCTEKRKFL